MATMIIVFDGLLKITAPSNSMSNSININCQSKHSISIITVVFTITEPIGDNLVCISLSYQCQSNPDLHHSETTFQICGVDRNQRRFNRNWMSQLDHLRWFNHDFGRNFETAVLVTTMYCVSPFLNKRSKEKENEPGKKIYRAEEVQF